MDIGTKNGFVVMLNEQSILQIVLHIMTIIIALGMTVLSIYLLILVIKLARRGIVALDLLIEEKRSAKHD